MMERIKSKVDGRILHVIFRPNLVQDSEFVRDELIDPDNFLQGAFLKIPKKFDFRPHVHLIRERHFNELIAQESWVVIKGKIEVTYFDLDDSKISSHVLSEGDSTFTLRGGHSYRTLDEDALVYEFKSGPYEGVDVDKRFIQ